MLAGAGLVASRRDGIRIYYRLADSGVTAFLGQVQDFAAARLAEVEHAARSYLGDVGRGPAAAGKRVFRPAAGRRAARLAPGRTARHRRPQRVTGPRAGSRAVPEPGARG